MESIKTQLTLDVFFFWKLEKKFQKRNLWGKKKQRIKRFVYNTYENLTSK